MITTPNSSDITDIMKSVCASYPLYFSVPSPIPFPKKPPLDIPSSDFATWAPCVPKSG